MSQVVAPLKGTWRVNFWLLQSNEVEEVTVIAKISKEYTQNNIVTALVGNKKEK